jgi:glycosyltransferase involved in cell wall biosynthesis
MQPILVLTSTYPRWENDTEPAFVHYLCRQLANNYRVIVLAPHYPGARLREVLDGIVVHRFRYSYPAAERLAYDGGIIQNLKNNRLKTLLVPFFAVSQLLAIVRLCRKYRIRLVHAHWVIPQCLLVTLCRRLHLIPGHTAIICTSHGGDLFSLQAGILQKLKRFAFRSSEHVTVVSRAMKDRLQQLGCATQNVSVQPMGVDLTETFIRDNTIEKTRDLVFVGRLVEKKGLPILIDALGQLKEDFPSVRLTIVGDGPDRPSLEQQVSDLGLERHVEFAGARPNDQVPGFYQSAKIAVVPSVIAADGDQEGLGLVAVEAMGCGCAIIASDLPALRDVVTHEETGLVFRSADASDLAAKLRRLLPDSALQERLAANGRSFVAGKFDWNVVGSNYRRIMETCLGSQPRPQDSGGV